MANRLSQGTLDASGIGLVSAGIEVDPISRIEGHLGVHLATDASGFVSEANVHGNLWRGFENFLIGRNANDAITFTQRICGVCPVPHGQTSTFAVDAALGYSQGHITFASGFGDGYGVPKKAVLIRNLVLSAEFLMSSITHFYHLVALDYVQGPALPPWTPFFNDEYYHALLLNPGGAALGPRLVEGYSKGVWDAAVTQYVKALRIRRLTFEAGALFAGRMPMTSCFVGGGVTNDGTEDLGDKCAKYKEIMEEIGVFVIKEYVPLVLALGALYPNYDNLYNAKTILFDNYSKLWELGDVEGTTVAPTSTNTGWGAGVGNFLAWGAFPSADATGNLALYGGVYSDASGTPMIFQVKNKAQVKSTFLGAGANSVAMNLKECIAYSRYATSDFDVDNIDASGYAYPGDVQRTKPDRANGYTYIKAPRWNGMPCEVGPLARLVVRDLYKVKEDAASLLATTLDPYYGAFLKSTGTGLDPAMVHADLAVALLRDGLATLYNTATSTTYYASKTSGGLSTAAWLSPAGTKVDVQCFDPVTQVAQSTLETVYSNTNVEIRGAVFDWIRLLRGGLSVMDRLRARALESLFLVQNMIGGYTKGAVGQARGAADNGDWGTGWIDQLDAITDNTIGSTWRDKAPGVSATGVWGATEAPRGALAHFLSTNEEGKITAYQCVVPTTWNASPRDFSGSSGRGPIEQAMMYVPFRVANQPIDSKDGSTTITTHGGLEPLRVAHTFDPCIACAIH